MLELTGHSSLQVSSAESVVAPMRLMRTAAKGIDDVRLLAGRVVLLRQMTVWDRYQVYIVAAGDLLAFQSPLITHL